METLVIHSTDPSVQYLSVIYENLGNVTRLTESSGDDEIREALGSDKYDVIVMLGHGGPYGMYAPKDGIQFGRNIINPSHVELLQEKTCVGIWCYANMFADRYKLHGLFSDMVISELTEAAYLDVPVESQDEMDSHNRFWAKALTETINHNILEETPDIMASYVEDTEDREMTILEGFNFNALHFFE